MNGKLYLQVGPGHVLHVGDAEIRIRKRARSNEVTFMIQAPKALPVRLEKDAKRDPLQNEGCYFTEEHTRAMDRKGPTGFDQGNT